MRTPLTTIAAIMTAVGALALCACTVQTSGQEVEPPPAQPPPPATAPPPAGGGGGCLDIRAALVRCNPGQRLTHEGCPEPDYMQRCAPAP